MNDQAPAPVIVGTSDATFAVVPQGYYAIRVSQETVSVPAHDFTRVVDFARFLRRWAHAPECQILLHVGAAVAQLTRDGDMPQVTLTLQPTPEITELLRVLGKPIDQRGLRALLRSAPSQFGDAGAVLATALRSLKVTKTSAFETELDERGFTRLAEAKSGQDLSVKIPESITFVGPYLEDSIRSVAFNVDIDVQIDPNGRPAFVLTVPNLKTVQTRATEFVLADLESMLPEAEGWLIGIGRFQTQSKPRNSVAAFSRTDPMWSLQENCTREGSE